MYNTHINQQESNMILDHIYIVMRNADFTEGRGPMTPDKIFIELSSAYNYIMTKTGIMGSAQGSYGNWKQDMDEHNPACFNGYDIRKEAIDHSTYEDEAQSALREIEVKKMAEFDREADKLKRRQQEELNQLQNRYQSWFTLEL